MEDYERSRYGDDRPAMRGFLGGQLSGFGFSIVDIGCEQSHSYQSVSRIVT